MSQPASETVDVRTDDGPMPAQLWLPDGGNGPGLVLLQEIFGLSRYIRNRGADLAAAGYVVLARRDRAGHGAGRSARLADHSC